jgi:hypothetical protein
MTDQLPAELVDDPIAERHRSQLDAVPSLYKTAHERLCVELSLHMEDPEVVFANHHYTHEQAQELLDNPAFVMMLERINKEVRESGLSYRMKARAIAEDLLPHARSIATDPYMSAAVRADLIKWSARVSGLEPKEKGDEKAGSGLLLSITFAGQNPQQLVAGREPLTIEQET